MSWNIERFGLNKFITNAWDHGGRRQTHITDTIKRADPDVLVLIEVQTNHTAFGGLVSEASGGWAALYLLQQLRNEDQTNAKKWMLVPPAILTANPGYAEGIAVLFKSAKLSFEGPMVWDGARISDPTAYGVVPTRYQHPWNNSLPTIASQGGTRQNRLAGQYAFFNNAGARWTFSAAPQARSIWRTRFRQTGGGRFLDLYSLHFPPEPHLAINALCELARVSEIGALPAANEDRVIVGDFNVNVSAPRQEAYFRQLTGGPRARRRAPLCPVVYQRQFGPGSMTTVRKVGKAHTKGVAPNYGYAAVSKGNVALGLDNALVYRGGGAAAPANQTIVNRVIGTPFPPPAPPAVLKYPREMTDDILTINLIPGGGGRKRRFNNITNFGHLGGGRGASDHLGIVFELP